MLPFEEGSRVERVGPELVNAALDLGRCGLPEGELLVELRATAFDEGEDVVVEKFEVPLRTEEDKRRKGGGEERSQRDAEA